MSAYILFGALLAFTAISGYVDFRTGHIPNGLVLVSFVAALILRVAYELAEAPVFSDGLKSSLFYVLGGTFACALVPLLLFRFNALGGGDVKLLTVVGTLLGPVLGLQLTLYAFIVASVYGLSKFVYHGRLLRVLANAALLLINPFLPEQRRRTLPVEALTSMRFGPSVFVAACLLSYDALKTQI